MPIAIAVTDVDDGSCRRQQSWLPDNEASHRALERNWQLRSLHIWLVACSMGFHHEEQHASLRYPVSRSSCERSRRGCRWLRFVAEAAVRHHPGDQRADGQAADPGRVLGAIIRRCRCLSDRPGATHLRRAYPACAWRHRNGSLDAPDVAARRNVRAAVGLSSAPTT
jgi:hypothetical protein